MATDGDWPILRNWFDAPPDRPMLVGHPDLPSSAASLRTLVHGLATTLGAELCRQRPTDRDRPLVAVLGGTDPQTLLVSLAAQRAGALVAVIDDRQPDAFAEALLDQITPDLIVAKSDRTGRIGALDVATLIAGAVVGVATATDPGPLAALSGPNVVLFSSGSSGRPKGIIHTAESIAEMVYGLVGVSRPSADDVFAMIYSPGYITCCSTVTLAWRTGCPVGMYDLARQGLGSFPTWLRDIGCTYLRVPAAVFRSLLEMDGLRDTLVRHVTVAGESIHVGELERFRTVFPKRCSIRIAHGSTETSAMGTLLLGPDDPVPAAVRYSVPADVALRVDHQGEAIVSSAALLHGHLDRKDLDDERFVVEDNGTRWFRSGDRIEFGHDGSYAVLGRVDDRVKVNGSNVEPGVVEATLAKDSSVRACAVVAVDRPGGGYQLAAFVVAATLPPPSTGDLRRALRRALPPSHVPSTFALVGSLPLTIGGKVDRAALREIAATTRASYRPEDIPSGDAQRRVHDIVAPLLGLDAVGVDDDLLDLGMDSLMLAELQADLTDAHGNRPGVDELAVSPTVASIAELLVRHNGRATVLADLGGSGERLFLVVPGAGASVAYLRPLASALRNAGRVVGTIDRSSASPARVPSIAVYAEEVVTAVLATAPGRVVVVGHSWGGLVAAEIVRGLQHHGVVVDLLVLVDAGLPDPSVQMRSEHARQPNRRRHWRRAVVRLRPASAHNSHRSQPNARRSEMSDRGTARFDAQRLAGRAHKVHPVDVPALFVRADSGHPIDVAGWQRVVGRVEVVTVPGTHSGVLDVVSAPRLAAAIMATLSAGQEHRNDVRC